MRETEIYVYCMHTLLLIKVYVECLSTNNDRIYSQMEDFEMLNALTIHSLAIIATVKSCVCMFSVFFFFVPLIRIEEIVKRNYKWKFTRRWVFYLPVPSLILWFYRSFYKLFKSNQSKGKFFPSCQVKRFCFRIEKRSACSLLQYRYMY